MVPAFVEKPEQKEIDKFDQPPEMTAQLREVVEPDVFLTGEANLLVEGEDKRDAKENAITRAASVLGAHRVRCLSGISAENFSAARAHARRNRTGQQGTGRRLFAAGRRCAFARAFAAARPRGEDQPESFE